MTSLQVSPNPLETQSTIDYSLQQAATVTVKVYNTKGDCVKIWSPRQQSAGSYQLTWNGTDHNGNRLPKGIYVVSLHAVIILLRPQRFSKPLRSLTFVFFA